MKKSENGEAASGGPGAGPESLLPQRVSAGERVPADPRGSGYSDDELNAIYALGRLQLELGNIRQGESIFNGLNEIVPDYVPSWLGTACCHVLNKNFDAAVFASRQAVRIDPENAPGLLLLSAALLATADYSGAGTVLGEISERISAGTVSDPHCIRFFRGLLERYHQRDALR